VEIPTQEEIMTRSDYLALIALLHFAKTLIKPDGRVGVSHTAVIRVAQNREQTAWLRHEIESTVRNSKQQFPEYWTKMALA